MSEEKPRSGKIIDFEKRKKGRAANPTETQSEITLRHGLGLAKEVLESLRGIKLDEEQVTSQRKWAKGSSTESILKVLFLYENSRNHYANELIFAFAETLLSRFPTPQPPTRGRKG